MCSACGGMSERQEEEGRLRMVTVIILGDDEEKLKRTMASLGTDDPELCGQVRVEVIGRQPDGTAGSGGAVHSEGIARLDNAVSLNGAACSDSAAQWAGTTRMDRIAVPDAEFVTVIRAGEYYHGDALRRVCACLKKYEGQADVVLLPNVTSRTKIKETAAADAGEALVSVESASQVQKLPACMRGMLVRAGAVRAVLEETARRKPWSESGVGETPAGSKEREAGEEAIRSGSWPKENEEDRLVRCQGSNAGEQAAQGEPRTNGAGQEGGALTVERLAACWDDLLLCRVIGRKGKPVYAKHAYFHGEIVLPELEGFCPGWLEPDWYLAQVHRWEAALAACPDGGAPLILQAQLVSELRSCFLVNRGNRSGGVLTGAELEQFLDGCRGVLAQISNELITPEESVHPERRLVYSVWSALMCVKYGNGWQLGEFVPVVTLDLMECERGSWRIDCSVDRFVTEHFALKVFRNGREYGFCRTERYRGVEFFREPLAPRDTFAVEIPVAELGEREELEFRLTDGEREQVLPVVTIDYEAKLTRMLKQSYWCFDRYMARLREGGRKGIVLQRAGRGGRIRQELRLLHEILRASYGSKQMFLVRVLYWLTYPVYGRKNIWLTFDKLYKGGDCGEYFYRYMLTRRSEGITPGYVIREDAPDCARMRREGLRPLLYRSLQQRLMYLHASMVFATHSSVHGFCGFSKWEVRFVQDRLRAVNTCIQHGLSVQDLTFDSNRIVNNNKRYYCASPCEIENLSAPAYGYDSEVLRLTGVPRYDGLVNRDKKQILITPTWRAYIAMPPVMGAARPYNPDFKDTDYFRIFQGLLQNQRLKQAAERAGYEIVYLLHPVISAQKGDFRVDGCVRLLAATEANYEQLLTESSLMVTDYSGVQFDFAYMRKPVVYFHPPKLPPHYVEGGFEYETQGFGEICTETEELVSVLCGYLETGCALKPLYREREDAFFAFDDHENCRRIFEDAWEYQKSRR